MSQLSCLVCKKIPSELDAAQQKSFVTYTMASASSFLPEPVPSNMRKTITLLESRNLLAASGTTGLRTWEAALHLSTYLTSQPEIIQGNTVLELGAGTGYISILCARHLGAKYVLSTDGAEEVVEQLPENFKLNGLEEEELVAAQVLRWGETLSNQDDRELGGKKIDVVLGADVTYDGTAIIALVATFGDLFRLNTEVKILIAATIRNEQTFDGFMDACSKAGFAVEIIHFDVVKKERQLGPFYSDKVPIKLCCVTRR
ncbi:hypothetical protein BP6252_03076 [Coleophoma cylindrospora]|uniref:Uncharacterized protein n=1 Tax=Coleophoma cylindrospora TaxID=1849047 RepID=A0A3D8S7D9_9HELO|nr:hypothetical protein BP6252_03076 [Coleophoma cylindrospora]